MKKKVAFALSCVMLAAALGACSGSKPAATTAAPAATTAAPAATTAAPAPAAETKAAETKAEETKPAGVDWASKEAVTIRIGHTNSETDSRHQMLLDFAKKMNERTDGKVTIDLYGGGVLGTAREMVEGLQVGMLECVVEGYNCMSYFTEYGMDTLPFLYDSYDHFMKCWYDSEVGPMWIDYAKQVGFEVFAPSYRGFRICTSVKKFTNAEEVKGLRIRTPTTHPFIDTWQALETQATPMALAEVLAGLQQGTVEAQENPVILSYSNGFYDACKYVIKTNHVCGADIFMIDSNYWNKLDPDVQKVFKETAIECAKEVSKYNVENESKYFDMFAEKGCEIVEADVQSFRDKLANFVPEYFPHMQEICDKIAAVK